MAAGEVWPPPSRTPGWAIFEAQTLVTHVCGLPWEMFAGLTEMVLKPLFLISLRRSLFLVEKLPDRVALALWEYAGHPEARRTRGSCPRP